MNVQKKSGDYLTDKAVSLSHSVAELQANLKTVDPAMAAQLETKPLIASRSPWGVLISWGIGIVATKYGLGLDADTTHVVSGVIILAAAYAMRSITGTRIGGVFKT